MRLIECYIENFGKISRQKFVFKDGLNCIKEDNGSGKTTLAAFIKVMLYGMSDTKKVSLDENDRKHYLPWQGGLCGGSLTFEAGGKIYRVERSFAPKAAEDSLTVYDTATGRVCNDFDEGLGEVLFGIDSDGFERTVFLSERALTPKSDNKSISAKLSDLVGCDGDIGAMDEAMKRLEDERKLYQKKGGSGEIADTKAKIDEIQRRINALSEVEIALNGARAKMAALSKDMDAVRSEAKVLLREREEATVSAAKADYEKQYTDMKLSLEESIKKRTATGAIFGAVIPSFTDIDEASYKATEAKNIEAGIEESPQRLEFIRLSKRFDGRVEKAQIEDARAAISALLESKKREDDPRLKKAKKVFSGRVPEDSEIDDAEKLLLKKKEKTPIGCIFFYVLFALCCVIGVIFEQTVIAVGVVGILATLIIEAIIKSRKKREKKSLLDSFFGSVSGAVVSDEEEMAARLKDMRELLPVIIIAEEADKAEFLCEKIDALTDLFPEAVGEDSASRAEQIIRDYDRYAEMAVAERYIMGDRHARAERALKLRKEAEEFVKRFNTKTSEPFSELRSALTEYNRLTAEIVAKRDEMARLESLHSIGEGSQQKTRLLIEDIDRRRQANDERMASLSREYALTERMYFSYSEEFEMRDELSMRLNELEEILAKQKDNYETIIMTKKYITLAKDAMTARYLGKTKSGFLKYAEIIGGISNESFEMDTDFGITKQEGASTKSVEAYSRGTRDLFNLAARLALVDSLYEKEKPFIILDDPFTAFDDKKTDAALKLLREFSKERQIIYFTCSKARSV